MFECGVCEAIYNDFSLGYMHSTVKKYVKAWKSENKAAATEGRWFLPLRLATPPNSPAVKWVGGEAAGRLQIIPFGLKVM